MVPLSVPGLLRQTMIARGEQPVFNLSGRTARLNRMMSALPAHSEQRPYLKVIDWLRGAECSYYSLCALDCGVSPSALSSALAAHRS
jgi:hypothetical protein